MSRPTPEEHDGLEDLPWEPVDETTSRPTAAAEPASGLRGVWRRDTHWLDHVLIDAGDARNGRTRARAVVALALVPLIVLGGLVWGLWKPAERLDRLSAAIVNLDVPVTIDGKELPLGRELAAQLIDGRALQDSGTSENQRLDWVLTDAADAASGIATGRYVASLTLPKDFSRQATSADSDPSGARPAALDLRTSLRNPLIDDAAVRTQVIQAVDALNHTVTSTFVGTIFASFDTMGSQLGTAATGAHQLASGAETAASGAAELSEKTDEAATGATELASGADELASGLEEMRGRTASLPSSTARLSSGATEISTGAGELAAGVGTIHDDVTKLAAGAATLAAGTGELREKVAPLPGLVSDGVDAADVAGAAADDVIAAVADVASGADRVADAIDSDALAVVAALQSLCADLPERPECQRDLDATAQVLAGARDAARALTQDVTNLAQQARDAVADVAGKVTGVQGQVGELVSGVDRIDTGATTIHDDLVALAAGTQTAASSARELAAGAATLAGGARELAGATPQLVSGIAQSADGAGEVASATGTLDAGLGELASGTDELANGVGELVGGSGELASGLSEAVTKIPQYGAQERTNLADVIASPATRPSLQAGDIFGGDSIPLFVALALWLGATVVACAVRPLPRRAALSARSPLRLALSGYWPYGLLGLVGAALAMVAVGLSLETTPWRWVGVTVLVLTAGLVFGAVAQALRALFGTVGLAIAVLVASAALGSGFTSTAPEVLHVITTYTPLMPTVRGLELASTSGIWLGDLLLLLCWGLGALLVTTLVATASRRVAPQRLRHVATVDAGPLA